MKVLCPTDFSKCSVNALHWILSYLSQGSRGKIEIMHCSDFRKRADMFIKLNDVLVEKATEDIENLKKELSEKYPDVEIETTVFSGSVKTMIPSRAKKIGADLIVLGSTGLTALKNMTIGSVTEYVTQKSDVPVLAIPADAGYTPLKTIVLGVDERQLKDPSLLSKYSSLLLTENTRTFIVQAKKPSEIDQPINFDFRIEDYIFNTSVETDVIPLDSSVINSINTYVNYKDADMICLIHHKQNLFSRIFQNSTTKEELFHLSKPYLILTD